MSQNVIQATSILPEVLSVTQVSAANTETTVYTSPTNASVKIGSASLCNTSASSITVSLSVVAVGGTAGTTNRLLYQLPVLPGDTVSLHDYLAGSFLGNGDFISMNCSATGVNLILTGTVQS